MKTKNVYINERSITVKKIPADILEKIDRQATLRGETRSQYIRDILAMITESKEETDRIDREEKMFENVAKIIEINIDTLKKTAQTLKEAMDYFDDEEDEEDE